MQPCDPGLDPGELGGIGEGFCLADSAHPLTQLQLGSAAAKLSQPSPFGRGGYLWERGLSPTAITG